MSSQRTTYRGALDLLVREGYDRLTELSSGSVIEIASELIESASLEREVWLERRADGVFVVLPWVAPSGAWILEALRKRR